MRHLELELIVHAGDRAVQAFQAIKRFDPTQLLGPTLARFREAQPLRVDTSSGDRLKLFSNLLQLLDELTALSLTYELTLNEGPPEVIDGEPIWTPRRADREDVAALVKQAEEFKAARDRQAELLANYTPPPPRRAYTLLHERWGDLGFENLLPAERGYIYVWYLKVEVENGSFHQYFFNSAGDHAQQTLQILRDLGANETAEILSNAMALLDAVGGYSMNREERWKRLGLLADDAFRNVTDRFYDYREDITRLALDVVEREYMRQGLLH